MSRETISRIEVLGSGKLLVCLESGGRPDYSNIYREGVGVYWNEEQKGFISADVKDWSYSKWFRHIVDTASGCGIHCNLSNSTKWVGFPEEEKLDLLRDFAIKK
jgi:hypothetical protein